MSLKGVASKKFKEPISISRSLTRFDGIQGRRATQSKLEEGSEERRQAGRQAGALVLCLEGVPVHLGGEESRPGQVLSPVVGDAAREGAHLPGSQLISQLGQPLPHRLHCCHFRLSAPFKKPPFKSLLLIYSHRAHLVIYSHCVHEPPPPPKKKKNLSVGDIVSVFTALLGRPPILLFGRRRERNGGCNGGYNGR